MTAHEPPLVDSHFHIWRSDLPLIRAAWHRPPSGGTLEQALATLDAHGITFGVIAAASLYGSYNDYVRAALLQHRRLRATAIADPNADIYQLEQMKRDGFVGIRFVFSVTDNPPDLTSDEYRRLLRRVADLDWHVHLTEKRTDGCDHRGAAAVGREAGDRSPGHLDTPEGVNGAGFKSILAADERGRRKPRRLPLRRHRAAVAEALLPTRALALGQRPAIRRPGHRDLRRHDRDPGNEGERSARAPRIGARPCGSIT
jgi:hypothetical protein